MGSIAHKIQRRLRLLSRRFRYEVVRPRLSAGEINRRLVPGVGIDVGAKDGFSRLLAYHMEVTPAAPPSPADVGEGVEGERSFDWHREDHFGGAWPRRFVGAMSDFLDGSDLVLLWHKNKMLFLLDLAARYEATGDARHSGAWFDAVDSWCRQNPFMVGMNWRSPMETGTRLVAWSQSLARMKGVEFPSEKTCERIVRSVIRQAEFLAGHFSVKAVPNNHLIGEAATLCAVATYWPEFREAPEWMEKGETVLLDEARRQVLSDGVQYEVAVNYHLYVIDFYLLYLHAKVMRGEMPPTPVVDAVVAMLDAALALVSPSGRFPRVGDDSMTEFLTIDPARLEGEGLSGGPVASLLVRPEYGWVLGSTAWGRRLLGRSCSLSLARHFHEAGLAVFRSRHSHVVFTGGPNQGRTFSPGHLHADAGSFELEVDGEPILIDSGTYLYACEPGLRDHFRGAAAHNTVLVDGVEPARPVRSFDWTVVPGGKLTGFGTEGDLGFVSCERTIPGKGESEFLHRRALVFAGQVWIVVDEIRLVQGATPPQEHVARAYFHTPLPATHVASVGARKVSLSLPGGRGEWIVDVLSTGTHTLELFDGNDDRLGLYSRYYGDRQAGTTICAATAVGEACGLLHVIRDTDTSVDLRRWERESIEIELIGTRRSRKVVVELDRSRARLDGKLVGESV